MVETRATWTTQQGHEITLTEDCNAWHLDIRVNNYTTRVGTYDSYKQAGHAFVIRCQRELMESAEA